MTFFWVLFNVILNIIYLNGLTFTTRNSCDTIGCIYSNANMFDIGATGGKDIRITGLRIKCDAGLKTVLVYRCMPPGGYSTHITDSTQWALEAQRQINCNGFNSWTDIGGLNVFIPNTDRIGFTIHIPMYINPLGLCFCILIYCCQYILYMNIVYSQGNNRDNTDITVYNGNAWDYFGYTFAFNDTDYATGRIPHIEVSYEIADSMFIHIYPLINC